MSLPERDGVHGRYYLIHKPDTAPEVLAEADLCIQDVLNGTARENHSAYPTVVRNHNGTPFLPDQLLERYLTGLPLKGFPCEDAASLCDAMRRLVGWQEIRYELEKYIEKQVQERFFLVGEREDGFTVFPPCTVRPELRTEDVDEGLLRFACYVAVCCTVYGQSFESLKTEHILGLVSQLRPDMVKQLKTTGSGKLPKDIQRRKTEHFTASANDAFATIRITARDSTEECYAEILDYLCAVLEQEEFPRSYSVEFRGKEKLYLPIPGLPKKGVNQLFACAVQHPNLHPAMPKLRYLLLDGNSAIHGSGLSALQGCKLDLLTLNRTGLDDAGLLQAASIPKLSHIQIDHTAVTYEGLLTIAGNNYIKPVAHVQFTREQMEHFSQLQREKAKKPAQLDEQAAEECRRVLSAFFAEMTEWEQYMEQAGFEDAEAVPRLLAIWEKYVSEKLRPGYRPLGLSYSAQGTYNGEEFLDAEQITKNKLYIYTREKTTDFDRRFLMKRVGEGWKIDAVQERLNGWQRTGL